MIRIASPITSGCLFGLLLLTPIEQVFAKIVLVGDAYVDDKAAQFVVYYKSIPGVANPGQRKHVCDSFDELKDELRRTKNNGWAVDFERSYMSYIVLAGVNDDDSPRRPFVPATPSVANTRWKTKSPAVGVAYFDFRADGRFRVSLVNAVDVAVFRGNWTQNRDRVTLTDLNGEYTYRVNGGNMKLIDGSSNRVGATMTRVN